MKAAKQYVTVPLEVKGIDEPKRQVELYSATWDLDLGNDIIQKGAFARTISHFKAGQKAIPLVDSHNYTSIFNALGDLTEAEEDDRGVKSLWQIIDGQDGERTLDRVRSRVIRKASIGYVAVKARPDTILREGKEAKVRRLLELKWEETSLVLFPMNPAAEITAVKSFDDLLVALRAGTLTTEQKAELRALLDAPPADTPDEQDPSAPEPKGLAPEDPKRLALEATLRDLTLRSLDTAA